MSEEENFSEYRRLLVHRLDTLSDDVKTLDTKVDGVHDDLLTLKVKAATWGAVAGLVPTIIGIAIKVFS